MDLHFLYESARYEPIRKPHKPFAVKGYSDGDTAEIHLTREEAEDLVQSLIKLLGASNG